MFSFFKREPSAPITQNAPATSANRQDDGSSDGGHSDNSNDNHEMLDLAVEIGGNRGWTTSVTTLLYHEVQGLICVGTEGGAVYVYGDGFQYVRPWLTDDPNEVVSIIPLSPNRILVAFVDNSFAVMELPTLEVIDLLQPSWLSSRDGDLTAIYCDLPSGKNFVYMGTSEGYVHVLDVMEGSVRVCEFQLKPTDLGIAGQSMAISDIQTCPKDERYLAIACDGTSTDAGMLVVFDLSKHKIHKSFKTSAIANFVWHNSGDIIFASTRTGEIILMNVEKGSQAVVWNARSELIDDSEVDEENGQGVVIRKLQWMAPQSDVTADAGCLFVLLSATNSNDNDNLNNVVLGFSVNYEKLETVFALPPVAGEKIASFRLVPAYDKKQRDESPDEFEVTPALLLLTQRGDIDISVERSLKIIRCPTTPVSNWGLEIGALPDPRLATEVQPSTSTITCIKGVSPYLKNVLSFGRAVISGVISDNAAVVSTAQTQKAPSLQSILDDQDLLDPVAARLAQPASGHTSRRLSARDFFDKSVSVNDLERQLQESTDTWEMALVHGEHDEKPMLGGSSSKKPELRQQDVMFYGHEDGTVVVYGVSLPETRQEVGRGSIWLPLTALRCGTTSITAMSIDEASGFIALGDEQGYVVMYEVYDEEAKVGASDIMRWIYDKVQQNTAEALETPSDAKSLDDFPDTLMLDELKIYQQQHSFTSTREVFRLHLHEHVTSIALETTLQLLFVGTSDGNLHYCRMYHDLASNKMSKVEQLMATGACGAVQGLEVSYYSTKSAAGTIQVIPACYASFESGHIVVIDITTMAVLSYQVVMNKVASQAKGSKQPLSHPNGQQISPLIVVSEQHLPIRKPNMFAYHYYQLRHKKLMEEQAALAALQSMTMAEATPPPPAVEVEQPKRRTFFLSRAAAGATRGTSTTLPGAPSSSTSSDSSNLPDAKIMAFQASDVPSKLIFIRGNQCISLSLEKFFSAQKKIDQMQSLVNNLSASTSKVIADRVIITASLLTAREEIAHDFGAYVGSDAKYYIMCLDEEGWLRAISLQTLQLVNHSNLLESLSENSVTKLYAATILTNGSMYMLQKGTMLYAASIRNEDTQHHWSRVLPSRATPTCKSIDRRLALLHGREQFLAQQQATLKKRRSSVINLTSGPVDLFKIFSKTREQRSREELLAGSHEGDESSSKKATNKVNKTMTDMQELQESFAERGERINRIALKMDDFKQSALEYRQNVAAQKEILKRRNTRWGLF